MLCNLQYTHIFYAFYFQFQKKLLSEFEIPEILKEELEKDYVSINRDDMVFYIIFKKHDINIILKNTCSNTLYILCKKKNKANSQG